MSTEELYDIYKQHPVITTDSRDCPAGSIFIALRGESFDGNRFATGALEKGCAYAIVDAPLEELDAEGKYAGRLIKTDDALATFKAMARQHRRQFDIPVIGITGTNGKTTTKELVSAVLQSQYDVMFTQGNFNNDVGVPKTLFRLDKSHDMAVVEMGASHPGDIKTLVETAEPTCGLITNVGRAHLEGFGSFEGVKQTKGELYDYLEQHHCPAFVNTVDSDIMEMTRGRNLPVLPYAKGEVESCNPCLTVKLDDGLLIRTQLVGTYNLPNILAAVSIGRHFGIDDAKIAGAIENYRPGNNRSQLTITESNRLVVDAYNANPTSMAAAIENFSRMTVEEPKMLILGDMKELGAESAKEHQRIADMLAQCAFDEVWLVGDCFMNTQTQLRRFADVEEVKKEIAALHPQNRYILIKGSNSTKLWQLPEIL